MYELDASCNAKFHTCAPEPHTNFFTRKYATKAVLGKGSVSVEITQFAEIGRFYALTRRVVQKFLKNFPPNHIQIVFSMI